MIISFACSKSTVIPQFLVKVFFLLRRFSSMLILFMVTQTNSSPMESMMTENQKKLYTTMKAMLHNKPKQIIPMPKVGTVCTAFAVHFAVYAAT